MKKITLYLLLITTGFACRKTVKLKNISEREQIVINGFISPQDDTIKIRLSKSLPLGEERIYAKSISDAEVEISDAKHSATLVYNERENRYIVPTATFPIEPKTSYTLTVQTLEGEQVRASCFVPKAPPEFEVQIDSVYVNDFENKYYAQYFWKDFPNEKNYYRVVGVGENIYKVFQTDSLVREYHSIAWGDCDESKSFISDEFKDGQKIASPISDMERPSIYEGNCGGQIHYQKGSNLIATLLHVDENYFLFHKSLLANQKLLTPFDLAVLHSNVEGGLGIFAGYNKTEKVIQLN